MPWNGSGTFTRLFSWVADKAAAINITASRMDADSNDIITAGLGNAITRDGQGIPTANLPMGGFRHTNVQDGVARTDYPSLAQLEDGVINWQAAAGTADALSATYTPAIAVLKDGQLCFVRATAPNATTTPSFAPNGLTAHPITKQGGLAVAIGEWQTDEELILRYKLASTRWERVTGSWQGGSVRGPITMVAQPINEAAATLASAATVNIGAAAGNYLTISGTTGISSFGPSVQGGTRRHLTFQGALSLTNGVSLLCPGGQNLTIAAGDSIEVSDEGANVWRVTSAMVAALDPVPTAAAALQTPTVNAAGSGYMLAGPMHGLKNKLMNGEARVAQRKLATTLTTGFLYGTVDRCLVAATAGVVSAGTITQDTAAAVGRTGYTLKAAGVTTTGGACTISWKQRIESLDAVGLKNQNGSFQIRVLHDVGANVNYQITVRKPTVADNYGATTQIAQSGLTAVPTGTDTLLTFPAQALGDVSFGIEIQVDAIVGANVVTKNFHFTEWQLEEGPVCTSLERRPYQTELAMCQRYAELITEYAQQYAYPFSTPSAAVSPLTSFAKKRATPSLSLTGTASLTAGSVGSGAVGFTDIGTDKFATSCTGNSAGFILMTLTPGTGGLLASADL